MSTILDALKKSEQERKLSNLPTLTDMPTPQEQSRWPLIMIIGLLSLLVLLMLWFGGRWWMADQKANPQVNKIVLSNDTLVAAASPTTSQTDEIIVSVVSYAQAPEQRFAMINGKLYREQDFIKAGLKVETINPNSVVLNQRGRRIERKP